MQGSALVLQGKCLGRIHLLYELQVKGANTSYLVEAGIL